VESVTRALDGSSENLSETVYRHLRAIAQIKLSDEKPGHTLQATALVHEALLKVGGPSSDDPRHRGRFYGAAAEAMRRILIDHARAKGRTKRGGGTTRVNWTAAIADQADFSQIMTLEDIEALDGAIRRLQDQDARAGEVVRLKYFAGLGIDQIAPALNISPRTAKREWEFARAWLLKELKTREATDSI